MSRLIIVMHISDHFTSYGDNTCNFEVGLMGKEFHT